MPPSSSRRVGLRSRREPDVMQSDADTPDSIATPSRKRRRLDAQETAIDATRTRITESMASNDSNTTLPNGADADTTTDPVERQNLIIAALRTPQYTPNAAIDYANDLQARRNEGKNIAAFAKIAARDWCFFVQETKVLIGRADSSVRPHPPSSNSDPAGVPSSEPPVSSWGVHIDLGPERQISRVHAEINFNPEDQQWYITVNSRNGLKLDDRSLTRGDVAQLHSGICIGIMGTQMLFLLANQEDTFHSMLWRQVKNEDAVDSDNENNPPKANHAHPSGPTPKREHYDPFPPSSHPRNKHSSQAYYNQLTSTPGRPHGTPLAFHAEGSRGKGSPATFPRGLMLDSGDDIDYSHDSAKDIKPPHSYAQLIGQAILSSEEEMLTLSLIYDYIKQRYAFFRFTNAGWQNSIRHNLSLNKSFEKVARRTDEPGKGMKWKIADSERDDFIKKQMLNPRKGGGIAIGYRLDGSGPSSPAIVNPSQATERLVGALEGNYRNSAHIKSPPRSTTPPLSSVPMPTESYTPDRGPRPYGAKHSPPNMPHANFVTPAKRLTYGAVPIKLEDATRPLLSSPVVDPSKPSHAGLRTEAAHSPPPLYSDPSTGTAHAGGTGGPRHALVTPLVSRHAPRLAPPSTAQVPSQYINFSSPAPFWKFVDLPSTPARGGEGGVSPLKFLGGGRGGGRVARSSPPVVGEGKEGEDREGDEGVEREPEPEVDGEVEGDADNEDPDPESPSRTLSRPASRRHDLGLQRSRSGSRANGFPTLNGVGGMVRGASLGSFDEGDEDGMLALGGGAGIGEEGEAEEGYDLAKGFQKIGSFHRSIAAAHSQNQQHLHPTSHAHGHPHTHTHTNGLGHLGSGLGMSVGAVGGVGGPSVGGVGVGGVGVGMRGGGTPPISASAVVGRTGVPANM